MDRAEIRMRCLELAQQRHGANDRDGVIEIARDFAAFVEEPEPQNKPARKAPAKKSTGKSS